MCVFLTLRLHFYEAYWKILLSPATRRTHGMPATIVGIGPDVRGLWSDIGQRRLIAAGQFPLVVEEKKVRVVSSWKSLDTVDVCACVYSSPWPRSRHGVVDASRSNSLVSILLRFQLIADGSEHERCW